jgi:hypothetical protein
MNKDKDDMSKDDVNKDKDDMNKDDVKDVKDKIITQTGGIKKKINKTSKRITKTLNMFYKKHKNTNKRKTV